MLPLQGSAAWPVVQEQLVTRGTALALSTQTLHHLSTSYGSEATMLLDLIEADASLAPLLIGDLPFIRAEVLYACRYEMAMTPYDFLARRTSIILEDRQRGLGCLDAVVTLMAQELQWSADQQQALANAYRDVVREQQIVKPSVQTQTGR
jgi:glycerol-3-phosphate dehydrogenase